KEGCMQMDPVCEATRALGHSWWPSLHWILSLTAGDQAAWISGLGAFAAAFAAVRVAGAERKTREKQSDDRSKVAASFIYSDVVKLATFAIELHRCTFG